jgi:hypothetical protein
MDDPRELTPIGRLKIYCERYRAAGYEATTFIDDIEKVCEMAEHRLNVITAVMRACGALPGNS